VFVLAVVAMFVIEQNLEWFLAWLAGG